jgi:hypothetical protein
LLVWRAKRRVFRQHDALQCDLEFARTVPSRRRNHQVVWIRDNVKITQWQSSTNQCEWECHSAQYGLLLCNAL